MCTEPLSSDHQEYREEQKQAWTDPAFHMPCPPERVGAPSLPLLIRDSDPGRALFLSSPSPNNTQALPLGHQSPCEGGCATAAVPTLPGHQDLAARPAVEPAPATDWSWQRQEAGKSCTRLRTSGRVDARSWSQASGSPAITLSWKGAEQEEPHQGLTVTLHCLEGLWGKGEEKPRRQERALWDWKLENLALGSFTASS